MANIRGLEIFLHDESSNVKNLDIYVVNNIREIYDKLSILLDNIPLDNPHRDELFKVARKLRIAEAIQLSPKIKKFIIDGEDVRYKVVVKGNVEIIVEENNPQTIIEALKEKGLISIKPAHPLIEELRETGIADVNLDDEETLSIIRELTDKRLVKVKAILNGIPNEDLHYKRRTYKPKENTNIILENIKEIEKVFNELPELLKKFLEPQLKCLENLKKSLKPGQRKSMNHLGLCPKCGSPMKYDLNATQPRTFKGELRPRKICSKCGYSEVENY